jgi:excisionase family DNA binding protein
MPDITPSPGFPARRLGKELEPLLSVREVADVLGVPKSCVYYLVKAHGLPVRKIGKYFRFYERELLKWIEERKEH